MAFQTLETALPEMSGWKMATPRGERMTSPVPFSKTEADYRNGEENIDGYEKAVSVGGFPAVEKWTPGSKRGELTVLVNDRFVVEFDGRSVSGVKTLHDFAAQTDFGKLQ